LRISSGEAVELEYPEKPFDKCPYRERRGEEVVTSGYILVREEPAVRDEFTVRGVRRSIIAIEPIEGFSVYDYKVHLK
jgi:hypothetical protein